jgi:hypothetical protein
MKFSVYNESGKWLMATDELGLNLFLGCAREAIDRCKREPVCELHFTRGSWSGRKLTVRHLINNAG